MKNFLKGLKKLFHLILLGAIYGLLIGTGFAVLTSNNTLAWSGFLAGFLAGAWTWVWAWAGDFSETGALTLSGAGTFTFIWAGDWSGAFILAGIGTLTLEWTGTESLTLTLAGATHLVTALIFALMLSKALTLTGSLAWALSWSLGGALVLAGVLNYLAQKNKITSEEIIENHIAWIFSFPLAIFRLISGSRSSIVTGYQKLESGKRELDIDLIVSFTQELIEVFPEEWDEWQHWISDMMEARTRMQLKGMNNHLVSLITFYRLFRFVWHIGIDKVFILATRRATR